MANEPIVVPDCVPDVCELVHELRVHEIELEMQNELLRAAQAELEADLARFVDLAEPGPVAYVSVTRDGSIERLNLAAAGMLGLSTTTPARHRLGAFVSAGSLPDLNALLARVFGPGGRQVCELELCPGGDGAPLTVHIEAVRDRAEPLCHLAGINISDRIRAERALRESRDDLNRAQAQARIGSWRLDAERGELICSDECARIHGLARGVPQPQAALLAAVHPDDRDRVSQRWVQALRDGGEFEHEYRIVAHGAVRWVSAHVWLQRDGDGARMGGSGTVQDITDRRATEQALQAAKSEAERADNAKSRFLAAASHDLRQPLAALALYVDVLQRRCTPGDNLPVKGMKDCVATLSELLEDLLDLSKLEAGVVTPEPRDFALDTVLARVISAHGPQARLKGLELRYAACDVPVRTDPVLLGRIAANLVSNAIRYTERGGVLVGCRRRGGRKWLEVWDSGVGVPADKIGEIFEEFRQLGNEQRAYGKGSGLGLAIVKRAAALLGLQLRVRSVPGKGSLFAVELPHGHGVAAVEEAPSAPRVLRIGLVEDNPAVLAALALSLRTVGHQVVAAERGGELIERPGERAPDVVISDYRLGGSETGLDVVRAARRAFGAQLPAVIVTGDTDPRLIAAIAGQGVALQHKPVELDVLQRTIAGLVHDRPT